MHMLGTYRNMFLAISFVFSVLFAELFDIVNCECMLPEIRIDFDPESTRAGYLKASGYGWIKPDEDGYFYFSGTDISIWMLCQSLDGAMDLQYIAEETQAIINSTHVFQFSPVKFAIASRYRSIDGRLSAQFYCVHSNSPCGYTEMIFTTSNKTIQGRLLYHKNSHIVPLSRSHQPISNRPPEMPQNKICAFEFFVRVEFNILKGNCTVNYNGTRESGELSFGTMSLAIYAEAHLRDRTTNEGCIHFLNAEDCSNCLTLTEFRAVPVLLKCTFMGYKAHQFFISSLEKANGGHATYTSWNEMNAHNMIILQAPDVVTAGNTLEVQCVFSKFVFAIADEFAYREIENGKWQYVQVTKMDDALREKNFFYYTEDAVRYSDFYEVMCIARVWNSTEYVNKTKRIHIEKFAIEVPKFLVEFETITLYENECGKLWCNLASSLKNITYKWAYPTVTHSIEMNNFIQTNEDILLLLSVTESMEGTYHCDVENSKGTARKTFTVVVKRSSIWKWIFTSTFSGILVSYCVFYFTSKYRKQVNASVEPNPNSLPTTPTKQEAVTEPNGAMKRWKSQQPFKLSIDEAIGNESFGKVFRIKHTSLQREFALKKIDIFLALRENNWDLRNVFREIECHLDLNHKNIVKFYHCWVEGRTGLCDFELENYKEHAWTSTQDYHIFMLLELCDSTLAGWLKAFLTVKVRIAEENIRDIFTQILEGIRELHRNNIIHRDIKPANILYKTDRNGRKIWKIGDLGLARRIDVVDNALTVEKGTLLYTSPEMMGKTKHYTNKTDVFSLGLTLLEIIVQFKTSDDKAFKFGKLKKGETSFTKIKSQFNISFVLEKEVELLEKMLQVNPNDRIHLSSEFVNEFIQSSSSKM